MPRTVLSDRINGLVRDTAQIDVRQRWHHPRKTTTPGSAGNSPAPWATSGQPGPDQVTIQPHEKPSMRPPASVSDMSATRRRRSRHWLTRKLKITIESTFATVRHRAKVSKGPGSRAAGLAMAFKLIESAQDRWRAVNAPHLVALVRAGATFTGGKLTERPDDQPQPKAA
jgi:hypothetical protein